MKSAIDQAPLLLEELPVARVWAGHKVNMALVSSRAWQYAGYYDENRNMVIAMRRFGTDVWSRRILDTKILGWDSHNNISLGVDSDECLHVSGNMHATPMIYFRMEIPHDLDSIHPARMVGRDEQQCTYPRFMTGPAGTFLFHYRSGYSGNGYEIYNVYEPETRQWRRFFDQPLSDGAGRCNAYFFQPDPVAGPDGFFHLGWMWRDSGDCSSNHDICYARSRDLLHWENAAGESLALPLTPNSPGIVVLATAPSGSGVINMGNRIGFDSERRPVLSFHKYDENGYSRIYNARLLSPGKWQIVAVGNWTFEQRWEFQGVGSIPQQIHFSAVNPQRDGSLLQAFDFSGRSAGVWRLAPDTLEVQEIFPPIHSLPLELEHLRELSEDCSVWTVSDSCGCVNAPFEYILRWEAPQHNRDHQLEKTFPLSSQLSVCRITKRFLL